MTCVGNIKHSKIEVWLFLKLAMLLFNMLRLKFIVALLSSLVCYFD